VGTLLDNHIEKNSYIVNGENRELGDEDNSFSASFESLEKLDEIDRLHNSYFKKRAKYKVLKEYSPDHPDCKKLKDECSRIAKKSRNLLSEL
jgi:hypothetical protein